MSRASLLVTLQRLFLRWRRPFVVVVHLALVAVSNHLAFVLRFDGVPPPADAALQWQMLPWLLAIRGLTFVPFSLYQGLWRYTGLWDLSRLALAVGLSSVVFAAVVWSSLGVTGYPRSVVAIDALMLVFLLGGVRLVHRTYRAATHVRDGRRILVYGAGDAGELIVRDMLNNAAYQANPVGFIDDDVTKVGKRIHGLPVLGTRDDLPELLQDRSIDEVLIAIPSASPSVTRDIVAALGRQKVHITTLPNLRDLMDGHVAASQVRTVGVEDLLSRAPVGLDPTRIRGFVEGRRILITGAAGSIGSELARQVLSLSPSHLVLLDRHENGLFELATELAERRASVRTHALIADVTDEPRIDRILAEHRPHVVFHAAAHKHVPLMQDHLCEAVKNNVGGTRVVGELAVRYGVERFILVSTDKAVRPISVMGATKRVCELLAQSLARDSRTVFVTVRFGNVLASNGSVIPRFLEQIRAGGPVTVTHPEVRRFFMLIPEAVQLVLHAAAQGGTAGIYVLEMGEPMRILDLARNVIRLSGHIPDEEIPIRFVGLRPGEKLFEELVAPEEHVRPSAVEKVWRVDTDHQPDYVRLRREVQELEASAWRQDDAGTLRRLEQLSPFAAGPEPLAPVVERRPDTWTFGWRCPSCDALALRRSQVRPGWERLRKRFTARRPFRCHECGWRDWLSAFDLEPARIAPAQDTPDLLDPAFRRSS